MPNAKIFLASNSKYAKFVFSGRKKANLATLMQTQTFAGPSHGSSSLVDSFAPTPSPHLLALSPSSQEGDSLPPRRASQRWPFAAVPPPLRDGACR